ncbi:MAG: hypothetical protein ABI324_21565 [Ktedonobacteraceae bacterium]
MTMSLVRFRTSEIQRPYTHWMQGHNEVVASLHAAGVDVNPQGADHPWNDRSEYSIFEVQESDLPAIEQASQSIQCSYEYPCAQDIINGDMGVWHNRH